MEADDLLGGGCGPKYHEDVETLRKRYKFGKIENFMDESTEYGGRTLKQFGNFDFEITMTRHLREEAVEIKMERWRGKDQTAFSYSIRSYPDARRGW